MNWCLILNDFQTPPKKSVNSISFVHSFPLPWVFFEEAQGILQPHSNRTCHTRESFDIFLSLCLPQGTILSPCIRVQCSFPVVPDPCLDTGTLLWTFAGWGKESGGASFWFLPAVCCWGWEDLVGSQSMLWAEGSPERSGGWKLCETEEVWSRLKGRMDISNITVTSVPYHAFSQLWRPQGTRASPWDACSYYTTVNSLGFKSSSVWAFFFLCPSILNETVLLINFAALCGCGEVWVKHYYINTSC